MSTFYEDIVKGTWDHMEKNASTKKDVKEALNELSGEEIESLAEEIGVLTKEAEDQTTEEESTEEEEEEEKEEEEKKKKKKKKEEEEEEEKEATEVTPEEVTPEEGATEVSRRPAPEAVTPEEVATEKSRVTMQPTEAELEMAKHKSTKDQVADEDLPIAVGKSQPVTNESIHEDTKKSMVGVPVNADAMKPDEEYEVTASEILEQLLKEGSETEDQVVEDIYKTAEDILSHNDISIKDYIFAKVGHEGVTDVLADKVEKLASVSEKPTLQVADDLIVSMADIIDDYEL